MNQSSFGRLTRRMASFLQNGSKTPKPKASSFGKLGSFRKAMALDHKPIVLSMQLALRSMSGMSKRLRPR